MNETPPFRRHFERDPIPYALETDWPVGTSASQNRNRCPRLLNRGILSSVGGLRLFINQVRPVAVIVAARACYQANAGRQDSNLCIRIRAADPTRFRIGMRKFVSCPRLRVSVNSDSEMQRLESRPLGGESWSNPAVQPASRSLTRVERDWRCRRLPPRCAQGRADAGRFR
jgi:hypothetical protein